MDHHCFWTANCIGHRNRKAFNLILLWGSVGMVFASLLGWDCYYRVYEDVKVRNIYMVGLL
jgi:hypothetical protein